jgi:REP element-mobilizing transposase RayT
LHFTTRIRAGLPSLRQTRAHALLVRTLRAGSDRFGFRLIEYSVQSNHFHMLVEVADREALTRGAKGILVRLAKQLNRLWGCAGQVFPDRYHVRELTSPIEVRRALAYVLHNARRHGAFGRGIDPFSSGPWFDGFAERPSRLGKAGTPTVLEQMQHWPRATCRAGCWLLRAGWQRIGLIRIDERVPAWREPC